MSILAFLAAIGVITVTYTSRMKDPPPIGAGPFYRFRFYIALVVLLFGPLLFVSIFLPRYRMFTNEEKLAVAEKYRNEWKITDALRRIASQNREDINAQIRFIDFNFAIAYNSIYLCSDISKLYKGRKHEVAQLAQWYVDKKCHSRDPSDSVLLAFDTDNPGVNYMLGYAAQIRGDYTEAELYYSAEISINPDLGASYKKLFEVYQASNLEVLAVLMQNPHFTQHIDPNIRRMYYYKFGYYGSYLKEIFNLVEEIPRISTFVIALLCSLIWIGYLWMMDIFNREKWYDILAVFALGSVSTLGVTIFYDYFHLTSNFSINGEGLNDFLYCSVVIGGSEELVKFLPWIAYGVLFKKLKEPFDYILYASVAALGFAFVENLIYFENFHNIVIRTMMSTVGHVFDASIIAFAFVFARYRMPKNSPYKWLVIVLGFVLAMLAHGFYDFWLISPGYKQFAVLTYVFYFISLHLWFYFKNNAINHSPYFCDSIKFDRYKKQDYINFTLVFVLVLQYVVISFEFGSAHGVYAFQSNVVFLTLFILYMFYQLNRISVERALWTKLNFGKILPFKQLRKAIRYSSNYGYHSVYRGTQTTSHGGIGGDVNNARHQDQTGLELRLFAPKSNPYIGNQLPISGKCIRRITVAGDSEWYVFALNNPVKFADFVQDKVIIRHKNEGESLRDDKVEILFMFIPNSRLLNQYNIDIKDLRYADRAYSRPI